jgi:Mce-associated membrane protein
VTGTPGSQATPSWYDVLGVAPDASADEVRAAWRAAIADLDPTDPRFASRNRAAEVLLDPDRRAAYDAEVAPAAVDLRKPPGPAPRRTVVPAWLLAGLAVVTLVVAGVALWLWVKVPSDQAVEDATSAAQSAAERAVGPILSYDARHIDDSRAAAEQYLTSGYRKDYDDLFNGIIKKNAPSTGTVLKATLVRTGVVRTSSDATRVQVFALVDQTRTNKLDKQPTIYKNWVTITMEKVGDDWLVADMRT